MSRFSIFRFRSHELSTGHLYYLHMIITTTATSRQEDFFKALRQLDYWLIRWASKTVALPEPQSLMLSEFSLALPSALDVSPMLSS